MCTIPRWLLFEFIKKIEYKGDFTVEAIAFDSDGVVNVARATSEFAEADYQKFNMSLCQYMDSIELAMYR